MSATVTTQAAYALPPGTEDFLKVRFPRPSLQAEWLLDASRAIGEKNLMLQSINDDIYGDGLLAFFSELESKILCSKFSEIMQAGSGLPRQISFPTMHTIITGPIVLELIHMTDVGCSALALEKARIDRDQLLFLHLSAAVRDRRTPSAADLAKWEKDLPAFPRGSLKLLLTDGFTELEARELKPLPMVLGMTPMGIKVSLRNVPVVGGVAYLEPSNTSVCGGCVDERKEGYLIRLQAEFRVRVQEEIALMAAHRGAHPNDLFSIVENIDQME